MIKKLSILLAISAALFAGCDDDNDKNKSNSNHKPQLPGQENNIFDDKPGATPGPEPEKPTPGDLENEPCTHNLCMVSYEDYKLEGEALSSSYMACENGAYVLRECEGDKVCVGGSCVEDNFGSTDDCSAGDENLPDGTGYCTENGEHAIVCKAGKVTVFTCKEPCSVGEDNIVNCPKEKAPGIIEKECNPKTYVPTCINGGANALVCQKGQINTWSCGNNDCNVAADGAITCSHIDVEGALHKGGTIGDDCSWTDYTETCGKSDLGPFSVTCFAGKVAVTPCGICVPNEDGKTVSCTGEPACDSQSDDAATLYCMNNNSVLGYCTYDDVWEVTACASCSSQKEACMMQ